MKQINFNLQKIMMKNKLLQADVSRMTGIHKNQISIMLKNPVGIQFKTLTKLCSGLDLKIEELLTFDETII